MYEAYRIGCTLVMDESKVMGPLAAMLQALDRLDKRVRSTQASINEMVSGLRNASTATRSLADQMERVAKYAASAARSNFGSAAAASSSYTNGQPAPSQPGRALVSAPRLLTYGGGGSGFTTQGAPYGPGTSLVPSGPGRQWDTAGPSPNRGAVAVWAAQNGWTPPKNGIPQGGAYTPSGGALVVGGGGGGIPIGPLPTVRPPRGDFPVHSAYQAGIGAGVVGIGAADFLKDVFEAGEEPGAYIARMVGSRATPAQIAKSEALARAMVLKVPGFRYAQGLDLINQTTSFTGNVEEAQALSPALAFDAQVLSQFGKKDAIQQVESAIKAGELTGLSKKDGTIDTVKLIDFVNRLTSVVVSGAGTLDINKYLTGLRKFGIGATAASVDFNTAVFPAYMKILSEAQAGTALASLQQVLLSPPPNTRNTKYIAEQKSIGMRGADGELLQSDMLQDSAFNYTTQFLLPLLNEHGFTTPKQIKKEIYKLFPRQTVTRFEAAGIFDESVINKEANRNRDQINAGAPPLQAMLDKSPTNTVAAFQAAVNLFMVTLADPNMGAATMALKDISGAFLYFAYLANKNKLIGRILIDAAVGIAVLGTAVGGLLLALGPAIAMAKLYGWLKTPASVVNGIAVPAVSPLGRVAGGAGKLLGPAALGYGVYSTVRDDFFNPALPDANGMYPDGSGLLNNLKNIGTATGNYFSGKTGLWNDSGGVSNVTINHTSITNLDSKLISKAVDSQTYRVAGGAGTQSGTGAFDPKMGVWPGGLQGHMQ